MLSVFLITLIRSPSPKLRSSTVWPSNGNIALTQMSLTPPKFFFFGGGGGGFFFPAAIEASEFDDNAGRPLLLFIDCVVMVVRVPPIRPAEGLVIAASDACGDCNGDCDDGSGNGGDCGDEEAPGKSALDVIGLSPASGVGVTEPPPPPPTYEPPCVSMRGRPSLVTLLLACGLGPGRGGGGDSFRSAVGEVWLAALMRPIEGRPAGTGFTGDVSSRENRLDRLVLDLWLPILGLLFSRPLGGR